MKALVKHSPKVGIWMEDVPIPECGTNEVKIKITHTGFADQIFISINGTSGPNVHWNFL
ncbi:MAG: hypothetical protein CM1200mP1_07970 [Candidatus Neomarinimicrobiota bacterium]|nr:MAG: hypothetical protein CM1200mP1_07970 [Candidatus Neomarinimicrobiota bacterium]